MFLPNLNVGFDIVPLCMFVRLSVRMITKSLNNELKENFHERMQLRLQNSNNAFSLYFSLNGWNDQIVR